MIPITEYSFKDRKRRSFGRTPLLAGRAAQGRRTPPLPAITELAGQLDQELCFAENRSSGVRSPIASQDHAERLRT